MTESPDVSIDDVRELVAERQRYDDWLRELEQRRDDTPSRVFTRVHEDYTTRRDVVQAQLHDHVESLVSVREERQSQLAALDAQLATLEDERAEAMLRTAVGEFDDARWEKVRSDVESQIEDFTSQRDTMHAEVEEVSALLVSAGAAKAVNSVHAAATTDEESDATTDSEREPADRSVERAGEAADSNASDEHEERTYVVDLELDDSAEESEGSAGDENNQDSAVVSTSDAAALDRADDTDTDTDRDMGMMMVSVDVMPVSMPEHNDTADSGVATEETSDVDDNTDFDDALALFNDEGSESGAHDSARDGSRDNSRDNSASPTTATVTPQAATTVSGGGSTSSQADADDEGFDDLAFLRSVVDPGASSAKPRPTTKGEQQQKTLRCTECSTMNLPTEWYCERCGGELAAF